MAQAPLNWASKYGPDSAKQNGSKVADRGRR
jgi:hypothetical protein